MPNFKQRLAAGELLIGGWITLPHPAIAEIMSRAGFAFIVVDLEHSATTIGEASELIRVIDLCGVPALVRTTSNDADQIKRVMDAGAHGVIVPMIKTPEQATASVTAVRYPVRGKRGVGLGRAQGYGVRFDEYCKWVEESSIVIVQIEHIDAIERLDEILSIDGIDGYIVGPYDLSASMGLRGQFEHPDVKNAIERVRTIGKERKKTGGIHIIEPDLAELRSRIAEGFCFIAYSVDFRMIDVACRSAVAAAKS